MLFFWYCGLIMIVVCYYYGSMILCLYDVMYVWYDGIMLCYYGIVLLGDYVTMLLCYSGINM